MVFNEDDSEIIEVEEPSTLSSGWFSLWPFFTISFSLSSSFFVVFVFSSIMVLLSIFGFSDDGLDYAEQKEKQEQPWAVEWDGHQGY